MDMSKVFKKGFFVLALLSLFGCSTTRAPDQNSMSGNWHGKISLPEQALYISVELQQKSGSWTGSIDIPQHRLTAIPFTEFSVDGADVRFCIPGMPGDPGFVGLLVDGCISGEYRQSVESREFYLGREPLDIPGMLT